MAHACSSLAHKCRHQRLAHNAYVPTAMPHTRGAYAPTGSRASSSTSSPVAKNDSRVYEIPLNQVFDLSIAFEHKKPIFVHGLEFACLEASWLTDH